MVLGEESLIECLSLITVLLLAESCFAIRQILDSIAFCYFLHFAADSISNVDCLGLQLVAPHVCCGPDTGDFCQIQCNNGLCRCVHPLTGVQIGDFTFPDNDESIDCSLGKSFSRIIIHACFFLL